MRTKVVVFAASKGGVGKSTLAFNVGIHAAATEGIQLADVDPQQSLFHLCQRRRDTPQLRADNPMLLEGVETVARTVADLTASGYARDFLIVDTPGSFMTVIREAIAAADVIVLPILPSPSIDVVAARDALDLVQAAGKAAKAVFVINRSDARSRLTAATLAAVGKLLQNKPVLIGDRAAYALAPMSARAGVEISKDASKEIATLWTTIVSLAEKTDEPREVSGRHAAGTGRRRPRQPR